MMSLISLVISREITRTKTTWNGHQYYRKKPLVQVSDKLPEKKEKSYAELAREEARADLKRKRSAKYLTQDVSFTKRYKPSNNVVRQANQPTAPFQKGKSWGASKI